LNLKPFPRPPGSQPLKFARRAIFGGGRPIP
jgi:hypothetical protein